MILRKLVFTLIFFAFLVGQSDIKGKVVDKENNQPIVSANVFLRGSTVGSYTDLEGNFSFASPPGQKTAKLIVSYVGYKEFSKKIDLTQDQNLTVELRVDIFGSEEIVVVGAGSRTSKAKAPVSVTRIKAEEITKEKSYTSVAQLISGRVAGVNIQSSGGNVGSGVRFNIRAGANFSGGRPLVIIDGIKYTDEEYNPSLGGARITSLNGINPSDIESIEIIKGAAGGATYGPDAASGVIIIKTKNGQIGTESLSMNIKRTSGSSVQAQKYTEDDIVSWKEANKIYERGSYDEIIVSLKGSGAKHGFYVSVTDRENNGTMLKNVSEFQSMRGNFRGNVTEKLNVTAKVDYNLEKLGSVQNDNNVQGWIINTVLLPTAFHWNSYEQIVNNRTTSNTERFTGSLSLAYQLNNYLELSSIVGIDSRSLNSKFVKPYGINYGGVAKDKGTIRIFNLDNRQYTLDFKIVSEYEVNDIQMRSMVLTQYADRLRKWYSAGRNTFPTYLVENVGSGKNKTFANDYISDYRTFGFLFEQQFTYDDKFFLTASLRNDRSSVYEDIATISYPAIRMAYRLDKEDVLPDMFGLFKIRSAFGQSGKLPSYTSVKSLYAITTSAIGGGTQLNNLGDPNLKPEVTSEYEFGVEMELFNTISIEMNYIHASSKDAIVNKPVSYSLGTRGSKPENIGQLKTNTFEALISVNPIKSEDFDLNLSTTFTYQQNKVTNYGGEESYGSWSLNVLKEGLPKSAFYGHRTLGAKFKKDGSWSWENGGLLKTKEKVHFGNPYPDMFGAINLNATIFKNITVSAQCTYAINQMMYNGASKFQRKFGNSVKVNKMKTEFKKLSPTDVGYKELANRLAKFSSRNGFNMVEDADYFKLKEISIGYNFSEILKKHNILQYIKGFSVSFSARNLWISTPYSGGDPENNYGSTQSTITAGLSFATLPEARSYHLSFNLSL